MPVNILKQILGKLACPIYNVKRLIFMN